MANIPGYTAKGSAISLLRSLALLGLVDAEGIPTELAKKWRIDESYAEACDSMLRTAFPIDIVEAVPSDASGDVLVNLFMARGLGEGSAKNLARTYQMIAAKVPPDGRKPQAGSDPAPQRTTNASRKTKGAAGPHSRPDKSQTDAAPVVEPVEGGMTVLRYFLDRGRLAEIRVPRDLDEKEKKRLFAHLRIDLLDEVTL